MNPVELYSARLELIKFNLAPTNRFFDGKLFENRKYWSKLDETWSAFYRVGRSGATGRLPRAKFGPEEAKKIKNRNKNAKQKSCVRGSPYIFFIYYTIYTSPYLDLQRGRTSSSLGLQRGRGTRLNAPFRVLQVL